MKRHLSSAESQRYDRQIRVWGAEAQSRIQTSKVLVCGMSGVNAEVLKNIILAGVNVVVQDSSLVEPRDLSANFFLNESDIGKMCIVAAHPKLKELNGFADIETRAEVLESLEDAFFEQFDVVALNDCSEEQIIRVNKICRKKGSVLFVSGTFGTHAWFMADFGESFQYTNDPPNNKELLSVSFPCVEQIFATKLDAIGSKKAPLPVTYIYSRVLREYRRSYKQSNDAATSISTVGRKLLIDNGMPSDLISPDTYDWLMRVGGCAPVVSVCSVLGSFLAQEVIKAVSRTGLPAKNFVSFTADDYIVRVSSIG